MTEVKQDSERVIRMKRKLLIRDQDRLRYLVCRLVSTPKFKGLARTIANYIIDDIKYPTVQLKMETIFGKALTDTKLPEELTHGIASFMKDKDVNKLESLVLFAATFLMTIIPSALSCTFLTIATINAESCEVGAIDECSRKIDACIKALDSQIDRTKLSKSERAIIDDIVDKKARPSPFLEDYNLGLHKLLQTSKS